MIMLRGKIEKAPFTTGLIRKITVDLSAAFVDKRITIAGWQTVLATTDYTVAQHLTFKIHDPHNASIPLLPFCAIEDKWIKEIYLTNDADQDGISVDFLISNPPTKLNYAGISLPSSGGNGEAATEVKLYTASNQLITATDKKMRLLIACCRTSVSTMRPMLWIKTGGITIYRYYGPAGSETESNYYYWIPGGSSPADFTEDVAVMPVYSNWIPPIIGNGVDISISAGGYDYAFIYEEEI